MSTQSLFLNIGDLALRRVSFSLGHAEVALTLNHRGPLSRDLRLARRGAIRQPLGGGSAKERP